MSVDAHTLIAEDQALKAKVSGLTVASTRPSPITQVGVWFRWPEREYGEGLFPFITIDLLDAQFDPARAHSYSYDLVGPTEQQTSTYLPDDTADDGTTKRIVPYPTPLTLIYMVATHCRNARHDRDLFRQLLRPDYLPWRFGYLHVPQDETVRRLDVIDIQANTDYDSLKKRVFRRIWTIGVSAEMLPENWTQPTVPINKPILDPIVDVSTF